MWIRTQNKQKIINSDQIIDIFVGKSGTKIVANTTSHALDASEIILGEYKDKDTCLKVLEHILIVIGKNLPMTVIPFGGDVDEWYEIVESANFE